MGKRYDLSRYETLPIPSDERIEHAVDVLTRLSEIQELDGSIATFWRHNLECTGVWPDLPDLRIQEIEVPVESFAIDYSDSEGSWRRLVACCRLAIRQGIERCDLEQKLTREALQARERAA